MELQHFPDNLPLDERATILDRNIINYCQIEKLLGNAPLYTSRMFLEEVDRSISTIFNNRHFSGSSYQIFRREGLSIHKYQALADLAKNSFPYRNRGVSKGQLLRRIMFCQQFLEGNGYIVNEGSSEDMFGMRMQYYRRPLTEYAEMLPKVYLFRKYGNIGGPLNQQQLNHAATEYRNMINGFDSEKRLSAKERGDLFKDIYYFSTSGWKKISSQGLWVDVGLVALGCAVHARKAIIYSNDSDVRTLTIFADKFLGLEHSVKSKHAR